MKKIVAIALICLSALTHASEYKCAEIVRLALDEGRFSGRKKISISDTHTVLAHAASVTSRAESMERSRAYWTGYFLSVRERELRAINTKRELDCKAPLTLEEYLMKNPPENWNPRNFIEPIDQVVGIVSNRLERNVTYSDVLAALKVIAQDGSICSCPCDLLTYKQLVARVALMLGR